MEVDSGPLVEFFRAVPQARMPARAERSAFGSLPTAAYRYCEPLTTATSNGWYVYVPIDFALVWDGFETLWTYDGADAWFPLTSAQFPGFAEFFRSHAPETVSDAPPIFLADSPRRGIIQVWSGLFARTASNWSLLVRPLVNYPTPKAYEVFEAVIESDRWFGPLFVNIRLVARNRPIRFSVDLPMFQAQLLQRSCYGQAVHERCILHDRPLALDERAWAGYEHSIVSPNKVEHKLRGEYARHSRRRSKSEID